MTLTRRSTLTIAGGAVAAGVIGYLGRRQFASTLAPDLRRSRDRHASSARRTSARPSGHSAIPRPR